MSPCLARELLLRASIDIDSRFQHLSADDIDRLYAQLRSWLSCLNAKSFNPTLSEETRQFFFLDHESFVIAVSVAQVFVGGIIGSVV